MAVAVALVVTLSKPSAGPPGPGGSVIVDGQIVTTADPAFTHIVTDIEAVAAAELGAGRDVTLTIRRRVQQAAYAALADASLTGSVVALDPQTGAILTMVTAPGEDPINRAVAELYTPGSTAMAVTAAAALSAGLAADDLIVGGETYTPPGSTIRILNSPGVHCPEQITLADALRVSCRTAFARLCVERIGVEFRAIAEALGLEATPHLGGDPDNHLRVAQSRIGLPAQGSEPAALAHTCIGFRDMAMTPLQGALVAATIANGGRQMRPYAVADTTQEELAQIPAAVAADLRVMLELVVTNGTGTSARIDGYDVGGKPGVAYTEGSPDHGRFIGFTSAQGRPLVAVAVFLQNFGAGASNQAAAVARTVMAAAVDESEG